jgi:hypothetical protein
MKKDHFILAYRERTPPKNSRTQLPHDCRAARLSWPTIIGWRLCARSNSGHALSLAA